jgi:uncharacterized protein YqgV (UPF0045/DUF77 family)
MKNKFEAVRERNREAGTSSGWTVKTKSRGKWYTVCDTWAGPDGTNAEERAKEIAALLNKASEAIFDKRVTVKIKDCDGEAYADHDLYFNAPVGMNEKKAVQLVNRVIRKVQKANPCDYIFEDLELALVELGFDQTSFVVADERW